MSDLYQDLKHEFQDPEYRYGYAESFLNTKLATQIKTLREQRAKTQAEVAALMGIKQPGYQRFEDVNHSVWKTDTLWNIARALGVRLDISFESFGTLPEQKRRFNKKSLERPAFENDPAFKDHPEEPERLAAAVADAIALQSIPIANVADDLSWLSNSLEAGNQAIATYAAGAFPGGMTLPQPAGMTFAATGLVSIGQHPKTAPTTTKEDRNRGLWMVPKPQGMAAMNPLERVAA